MDFMKTYYKPNGPAITPSRRKKSPDKATRKCSSKFILGRNMKFTEAKIIALYMKSLGQAEKRLSLLAVAEGRTPRVRGLNGWVFEQTIQSCLSHELGALGRYSQK